MSDFKNVISALLSGNLDDAADAFVENVFQNVNESKRWPEPEMDEPDVEELEGWLSDGGCEATDGCWVEPDGVCEHGHPSWLLRMGMI